MNCLDCLGGCRRQINDGKGFGNVPSIKFHGNRDLPAGLFPINFLDPRTWVTQLNASQILKRAIDLIVGSALLMVLAPLILFAALCLLILEGRPVFYISRRFVSRHREVPLVKLRTMVRDARSERYRLRERFMRDGYLDIPLDCEVYTRIGRLLERTQLVEVPQLLNVVNGSMSLIGNRPLPGDNLRELERLPDWETRFDAPTGITGVAQLVGKHRLQPHERVKLEATYAGAYKGGNIVTIDLKIAYHTVKLLLTGNYLEPNEAYRILGCASNADQRSEALGIESCSGRAATNPTLLAGVQH